MKKKKKNPLKYAQKAQNLNKALFFLTLFSFSWSAFREWSNSLFSTHNNVVNVPKNIFSFKRQKAFLILLTHGSSIKAEKKRWFGLQLLKTKVNLWEKTLKPDN